MRHVTFVIERIMCFGRRREKTYLFNHTGKQCKKCKGTKGSQQNTTNMPVKKFEVMMNDRINDRPHVR